MSFITAIRIVNIDFYMSAPLQDLDVMYSDFRGSSIPQVPVIRIFGSSDAGKKICLHVHGVFPYLYIPYDGSEEANCLKYQIAANIDKAINISFGQASSTAQHVYKITLVSGIPFYGYHAREHQFFKIFLFNPSLTRKVANMLQSEVILGRLYQPHESHIPYILQFMIDYNLHGMSRVLLSELKFRTNSPPKQSTCELEADALCEHILNRLEVAQGNLGVNPGIAALWEDERQRLRDKNEDSQIGPCLTLDNSQVEPTKTHKIFKRALSEKLCLSENVAESVDQSISVYPAETPRDRSLKNASFIEVHSSHSTSADESVDLNATFDDDAKDLFEILQDLGRKNVEVEEVDSILSQTQKEEEEEDGEEENFLDLSISMADTTPFKKFIDSLKDDEEINTSSDLLDTTLVPQLDGQNDGSSDEESGKSKRVTQKSKGASKYVALPIFLSSPSVNNRSQELQEGSEGKLSDDLDHVKRKLNFKTSSEVTICEDSLECEYKSEDKENICKVDTLPNQDKVEELMEENSRESLAQSEGLTVAELYDLRTNYRPKEGCSTKLTQNSQVSELKLSSESSSDLLTPNQVNGYDSDQVSRQSCKLSQDLTPTPDLSLSQETKSEPKPVSNENSRLNYCVITPKRKPPSRDDVINSLETLNIPKIVHQVPFYGDVSDVTGSVEIGHSVLKIHSKTSAHLEDWKTHFNGLEAYRKKAMPANVKWSHENIKKLKLSFCSAAPCVITPVKRPPTVEEVEEWLKKRSEALPKPKVEKEEIKKIRVPLSPGRLEESDMELSLTISPCDNDTTARSDSTTTSPVLGKESKKRKPLPKRFTNSCQITGVTLNNTYGFRITPENFQNARAVNEHQHVTILSLEVHVGTRGDLKPDPAYDSVGAIFYSIVEDGPESVDTSGVIAVGAIKSSEVGCDLRCVDTEEELFGELLKLIKKWDPDILVGYETELLSWGYLLERSQILGNKLLSSLSRIKDSRNNNEDRGLQITGRILLDVWRLLRHEIALQSYSFESIVYHLLHKRIALYSFKDLTTWWNNPLFRHRTLSHYLFRVRGVLQILEQLDLVGRTSELARLFGIQFYEVLSRGSQFRVESMMLRLAKPLNYIPVSPSVQQRAKMKAPEFLPLILEPESKLYVDPVIVLDFQSLYPSMIIAYNYCFSTCIGRATHLGRNAPFEFGATQLRVSRARVKKLLNNDSLNFSPCGVAYVKSSVRDGILPKMLREILDTRLMVKNSMKKNKEDGVLQKVLHNRQLGLKLIANVTYGYTAANFSGRMPAVELADSVVSKGRETLQRAIEMVENTPEWKAKVVYGDTDSLFVLVPGRSRDEAFEIGRKIADAVTEDNPDPVKLKLEKVYHPCILQTKKRYVGYMYESPDQSEPVYLAKGIETVRRDGCPAVAKMLEKCLRILFETKNVSLVKKYVVRQFDKIVTGRVSLQDLTFAKEYRGASGYRPGACVPALELARKWTAVDKRNEPRRSERVPYVIAAGPPGVPLIRLVRSPREFLQDPSLRPNAIYYITKVIIPPINRCFNLIGADLHGWFNQMPRKQFQYLRNSSPVKRSTISQYFASNSCAVCGEHTQKYLCEKCAKRPQSTVVMLHEKVRLWEQSFRSTSLICQTCTGILDELPCISLDCPVLYRVNQTTRDLQQTTYVREVVNSLRCEPEIL